MNKVKVIADANGSIITQNQNNPEYGYIRVEQGAVSLGRWANVENRVAFIQGTMENLSTAVNLMGLKANKELDGKIVIKEQFMPFYEGQTCKTYGDSGFPCLQDGAEIYRQTYYTTDLNDSDVRIEHNNQEDYREHRATTTSNSEIVAATSKEAFDVEDLDVTAEVEEEIFEL